MVYLLTTLFFEATKVKVQIGGDSKTFRNQGKSISSIFTYADINQFQ